jgi:hypothetical protein
MLSGEAEPANALRSAFRGGPVAGLQSKRSNRADPVGIRSARARSAHLFFNFLILIGNIAEKLPPGCVSPVANLPRNSPSSAFGVGVAGIAGRLERAAHKVGGDDAADFVGPQVGKVEITVGPDGDPLWRALRNTDGLLSQSAGSGDPGDLAVPAVETWLTPILLATRSVNQRFPSGPVAMSEGEAPAASVVGNSFTIRASSCRTSRPSTRGSIVIPLGRAPCFLVPSSKEPIVQFDIVPAECAKHWTRSYFEICVHILIDLVRVFLPFLAVIRTVSARPSPLLSKTATAMAR